MKSLDVFSCKAALCSEGGDRKRWCDTDSILRKCRGNSGWLSVACAEMKQWKMRLRAKDCTRVLTKTCCARSPRRVRRSKYSMGLLPLAAGWVTACPEASGTSDLEGSQKHQLFLHFPIHLRFCNIPVVDRSSNLDHGNACSTRRCNQQCFFQV